MARCFVFIIPAFFFLWFLLESGTVEKFHIQILVSSLFIAQVTILEDYADPFDAADQAGGTQTVTEKPTEDGYMEPYEAQKMMAGKTLMIFLDTILSRSLQVGVYELCCCF